MRWMALFLVLAIAACGGSPKRVMGPPLISVQEVEQRGDRFVARVRIDSPSSELVTVTRFDFEFRPDNGPSVRGSQVLDLALPPVAGDVVDVDLAAVSALPALAALVDGNSMSYVLEGEVRIAELGRAYPVKYQGRLRPTPGKPGSYR